MSDVAVIHVEKRLDKSKGARTELKRSGYLLGNITGKGMESVPVAVKKDELRRAINAHGRNAVFKLDSSNGEFYTVMVKEIQVAPILNEYQHVDFQKVSLSEEVKSQVSINIIGSEALESKRYILNRQVDVIPLTGLPQNIPHSIDIDVSSLQAGDNVKVGDISLPDGISTDLDAEQLVISISEARVQEVAADTEEDSEEA